MSYSIKIGEAFLSHDEDGTINIDAELVEDSHFPAYGDPTDHTNQRWPSYGAWYQAMEVLGLTEIMFEDAVEFEGTYIRGLMSAHPGATKITENHLKFVTQKLDEYRAAHPNHRAEYPPPPSEDAIPPEVMGVYENNGRVSDYHLVRGEWLEYCMKWALENCKVPVIVNI